MNSAWYGSTTKRERVIIVATRNDLVGEFYQKPTHSSKEIKTKKRFDYELNDLPSPPTINEILSQIEFDEDDVDNKPMNHAPKTVERFSYIPEGMNIAK